MASKYAYRSLEPKFGFRVNAVDKLLFCKTEDTPVTEEEALACEPYVSAGFLERTGADPMEGKQNVGIPTRVKGPGGKIEEKSPAPNTDARSDEDKAKAAKEPEEKSPAPNTEDTKAKPKGK